MKIGIKTVVGIDFNKTPSFGVGPVFRVRLNRDTKSEFEGISNTKLTGSFEGEIDTAIFVQACKIINDADVCSMESKYRFNGTCQSTEVWNIRFENGEELTIEDYGNVGPPSLKEAKEQLKALIFKVQWHEIEPRNKPSLREQEAIERKKLCHCGSGKRLENCHGLIR